MRPSHHAVVPPLPVLSKMAGRCAPRYQSRPNHPIVVGSSAGSSAADGSAGVDGLEVVGQGDPGLAVQVHLHGADVGQRGAHRRDRRPQPPLDVGHRRRPEGVQPAAHQLGAGLALGHGRGLLPQPRGRAGPGRAATRSSRPRLQARTISPAADRQVSTRGPTGTSPP